MVEGGVRAGESCGCWRAAAGCWRREEEEDLDARVDPCHFPREIWVETEVVKKEEKEKKKKTERCDFFLSSQSVEK